MSHRSLTLPADPAAALARLLEASTGACALVLKRSPICPVSTRVESEMESWLAERGDSPELLVAIIDVIAEKPLARGLTSGLGIEHQSPQALLFADGELVWHDSHFALDAAAFAREVDGKRASSG